MKIFSCLLSSLLFFTFRPILSEKSIIIDGSYFVDPPGGVEAMIQLSIALSKAALHRKVYVTRADYHQKWEKLYGDQLVRQVKHFGLLTPGDVFIQNEGLACYEFLLHKGLHIYVYLLASYIGCQDPEVNYISHNQRLTHFDFVSPYTKIESNLRLSPEVVIHPYISPTIIDRAKLVAGLQYDGRIIPSQSKIHSLKKNLILLDNDISEPIQVIIREVAQNLGGTVLMLTELTMEQMFEGYDQGKIVVDWCMRGSERCPLEASLFGAIPITNDCDTGSEFSDYPVPSRLLIGGQPWLTSLRPFESDSLEEDRLSRTNNLKQIFSQLFQDIFENYTSWLPDLQPLRKSVLDKTPESMVQDCELFLSSFHHNHSIL